MTISKAVELVTEMKTHFEEMQTKKGFEITLIDSREIAQILVTVPVFPDESQVCPRKINHELTIRRINSLHEGMNTATYRKNSTNLKDMVSFLYKKQWDGILY